MPDEAKPLTKDSSFKTTIGTAILIIGIIVSGALGYADSSRDIAMIERRIDKMETINEQNRRDIQKIKIDVAEMKKDIKYILDGINDLKRRKN